MKLKKISGLMSGLLLSVAVVAQDEVPDTQIDDAVVTEGTMEMEIPAVSEEEMVALIRQDCQEMAADEGLEGEAAEVYVESCVTEIMSAETDMEVIPEEGDGMEVTEEYADAEIVDEGEEIPPVTE
ncbi:MAG: hypothetical protein R3F02_01490 [Thiolinea sp.]